MRSVAHVGVTVPHVIIESAEGVENRAKATKGSKFDRNRINHPGYDLIGKM